jgi:hypothetical protein
MSEPSKDYLAITPLKLLDSRSHLVVLVILHNVLVSLYEAINMFIANLSITNDIRVTTHQESEYEKGQDEGKANLQEVSEKTRWSVSKKPTKSKKVRERIN